MEKGCFSGNLKKVAGTIYFRVLPVSLVLQLGSHFKVVGAEKYGEPLYGHAERSSLKMFSQKEGIDLEKALALLKQGGLKDSKGEATILAIAKRKFLLFSFLQLQGKLHQHR